MTGNDIAIIGMAGRFPMADDVAQFWEALRQGRELITRFTADELAAAGVPVGEQSDPRYVPARGVLDHADRFDAEFFGIGAREADVTDPQQRVFLECAWSAAEDAGYVLGDLPCKVGVFVGAPPSSYPLARHPELAGPEVSPLQVQLGNDIDFLATRVSYKLNLQGTSISVSSACSSSLVAVHLACQSLLTGEVDLAIAGGVSIRFPQTVGYRWTPAGILSADGRCRPFSADANGTVEANGVAAVVLKPLAAALSDGDQVYAVIKGTATNNDGAEKVGYTAPGVRGQVAVLREALDLAAVPPDTVDYVEAHGTGTPLGDPIEAQALDLVYGTPERQVPLRVGSVKSNVGHLNHVAGLAGLIKVALCLRQRELVASLHAETINPQIGDGGPIRVQTRSGAWPAVAGRPRRAAVSSFGMGGTNAHVVLEEAPDAAEVPDRPSAREVLPISAAHPDALAEARRRLGGALTHAPGRFADAVHTLQVGRRHLRHRAAIVATDGPDAAEGLLDDRGRRVVSGSPAVTGRPVAFMFPGQGSQFAGMGRHLYAEEPEFRKHIDACAAVLEAEIGTDLRQVLFSGSADIDQTIITQPALFTVEYAAARLWESWGVVPELLLGHSVGEFVAAALAEVFTVPDALRLVAARARLMQDMPEGAMLALGLSESQALALLADRPGLSVCAVNTPDQCVVGGDMAEVAALSDLLQGQGVPARQLRVSRAFHTSAVDGLLPRFQQLLAEVDRQPPTRTIVSTATGEVIGPDLAAPEYWTDQLRRPVRFAQAVSRARAELDPVFLEVGPGRTLADLARRNGAPTAFASMAQQAGPAASAEALARLWVSGVDVTWSRRWAGRRPRRVSLPTYPFRRHRHWLGDPVVPPAAAPGAHPEETRDGLEARRPVDAWFYAPAWRDSPRPRVDPVATFRALGGRWLVLGDGAGRADALVRSLTEAGCAVTTVRAGDGPRSPTPSEFLVDPRVEAQVQEVAEQLAAAGEIPNRIVHTWSLDTPDAGDARAQLDHAEFAVFWSLVWWQRALARVAAGRRIESLVVTTGVEPGLPGSVAANALALGPARVAGQEFPTAAYDVVDVPIDDPDLAVRVAGEASGSTGGRLIGYRSGRRRIEDVATLPLADVALPPTVLRRGGVYVLAGGLGPVGLSLASWLARAYEARLVLAGRRALVRGAGQPGSVDQRLSERLSAIEVAGGEVELMQADVADPADVQRLLDRTRERYGRVDGVLHLAGISTDDAFQTLAETTAGAAAAHFRAKARGQIALQECLARESLDFVLVMSSLASMAGGFGFTAYAAANAYLDVAVRSVEGATPWLVVNSDGWRPDAEAHEPTQRAARRVQTDITADEGDEVFAALFRLVAERQVAISTSDLSARRRPAAAAVIEQPAEPTGTTGTRHPRPDLTCPYRAPGDELEEALAALWEELLGVSPIGADDDFFELGGHSLIAMQLVVQLREIFALDVPLRLVFGASTVNDLAVELERLQAEADDGST